ncbi:uncharacterized protein C8A04DRAFT_40906 [Dichotomopilus funicola]|uniref:Uncharacterized protein n=1 Tax=Dichotomopilus funicola TaxID=1934379 RepID=A0AAN6UUT2_9PEZI|nr:hypothetical protein C8A04DRAFT_40906 [Dichotomopilus funicola]
MDAPNMEDPASTEAAATATANTPHLDSPVRVLVQTRTHLRHVWQREFDQSRERHWNYQCHFALDNVECWFLVDHHGPEESPPPYPPIVWYRWTGTEFMLVRDPLPSRVRRELRYYPFQRVNRVLIQEYPKQPPLRRYKSRTEEIRVKRWILYETLLSNLGLTEELLGFVRDCPEAAEWVKLRVPPEAWARLEGLSTFALQQYEPEEGHP